jgi:hypothetical protein
MATQAVNQVSAFVQAELARRRLDEVSAVQAAQWLDRERILADSSSRPGLPLRNLLRAGEVAGAEQRPAQPYGRWFIVNSG